MKKKLLVFCFLLVNGFGAMAQKEAAIWYFGNNAGLDFNNGAPVALTDGAMNTVEGCSVISDFNGDLLFYTDGITVWDRTHSPMPNGTGLSGHPSSTQSGIIVPHPGNADLYYVFTVDHIAEPNGLQYNIVDMTLNGGLGDIVTKNIVLETPVTEKLTAVAHANGTDIWVLAHRVGSNDFISYLVSATGLDTNPVVSSVGFSPMNWDETGGYMKLSPDGSLLVSVTPTNPYVQLFRFNSTTGGVNSPVDLESFYNGSGSLAYGAEFSADSSKLYITNTVYLVYPNVESSLYQFDLGTMDSATIEASSTLLSKSPEEMGALQLAIDGKIYLALLDQPFLSVINDPNVLGLGANYVHKSVSLGARRSQYGLPPFITSYFIVGLSAKNFCLGDDTEFNVSTNGAITSINWDFGDGNTSSLENPTHTYGLPGTYTVSVTATTASETKTESKDIIIYPTPVANLVSNYEVCSLIDNYEFDLATKDTEVLGSQLAIENKIDYYPTLPDAVNGTNALPTLYKASIEVERITARISNKENPSCFSTVSFDLMVKKPPVLTAATDWIVCDTDTDGFYSFNLQEKDIEILAGQSAIAFKVSYYENQTDADARTNALDLNYINTTSPQEIRYRIENAIYPECYETGSFNLEVITGVMANIPTNLEVCDIDNDGFAELDLTVKDAEILGTQNPSSFKVGYFESQLDADNDTNALNANSYINTEANGQTLYARVTNDGNSDCYQTVSFEIRVSKIPRQQTVADWQVCDLDNDGIFSFNLSIKNPEVLGEQSATDFTVSYHINQADADTGQNEIMGAFENTTNLQKVFYRTVSNSNNNCSITGSFDLEVYNKPTANIPTPMIVCDIEETGVSAFNLSVKDAEVLNGQSEAVFEVLYFADQSDADANQNSLNKDSYRNSSSIETLYARVQNKGLISCYETTSFDIMVNDLPNPNLDETYVICPDSPELIINGGTFESWSWKDANGTELWTSQNYTITEIGSYTLTVTQTANTITCEKTVPFEVRSSGAPEDFTTEIGNPADNVIIIVNVTGTGEFEYSTDDINYQPSNRLEVFPGEYTVYVRDIYLCRTISKEVIALGYQKFFSPNGDGSNDTWTVIGGNYYPDSEIYIYDRYGKLLQQVSPMSKGWDGIFNGLPLPESDYWFRYVFDSGKVFTGHFSLKR
ncbi:T9SS type B sorting domain-containing protein [Zobellia laminariae]|uniref:T9SS type B sorting domain-containing protein n=1 Tax=Zobellia laminariae TaxID=248906 RepID=UPI0012D9CD90|nr:PKD domain-containing protein [Zobellia laminariae]